MISFKLTTIQKDKLISKYIQYEIENSNEYIIFFAKFNNLVLTIYEDKNKNYKGTISGTNENIFLLENDLIEEYKKPKINEVSHGFINESNQIGSDEVGFGDFFGPIVVAATYVNNETLNLIKKYKINDSKKISDEKILEIVPRIINKIDYSILCVDNLKLTELTDEKKYNLNQIKSILHCTVLNNVYKKHNDVDYVFIDKFNEIEKYYEYTKNEPNKIENITFEIHGEEKFPSVALSSWIARYYFLLKIKEISTKYNIDIPLGASKKVDIFAQEFKDKFGIDELNKIVKTNFKNYKNLI